jgi:hypothetical protein
MTGRRTTSGSLRALLSALALAAAAALATPPGARAGGDAPAPETASAAAPSAPATSDEVLLAWRLSAGERIRYRITQDQVQRVAGGPLPRTTQRQVLVLALEVREVGADGTASIAATYEAVRVEIDRGGAGGRMIWDSTRPEDRTRTASPAIRPLAALVGITVTFRLSPAGRVSGVEGYERAIAVAVADMGTDPRLAAVIDQLRKSFGNEAMRRQLESILGVVPERAVARGATWAASHEQDAPLTGALRFTHDYRMGGIDVIDGERLARIAIATAITRTGAPAAGADAAAAAGAEFDLEEAASEGEAWFAVDAGRLARASLSTTLDVTVRTRRPGGAGEPGGAAEEVRQHIDQRTALERIPLGAPPF